MAGGYENPCVSVQGIQPVAVRRRFCRLVEGGEIKVGDKILKKEG